MSNAFKTVPRFSLRQFEGWTVHFEKICVVVLCLKCEFDCIVQYLFLLEESKDEY